MTPLTSPSHAAAPAGAAPPVAPTTAAPAAEYPKHEVLDAGAVAAEYPKHEVLAPAAVVAEYPKHEVLEACAVFDAVSDVICVTTLDGTLLFLNRAGRDLLGHVSDDSALLGCLFPTHTIAARELLLEEVLPAALRDGRATGDTALQTVDGRIFPARQTVIATPATSRLPATFAIVIQDVSIERHAAARLGESQRLFEVIARNSPDLLCLYDPADERIVWTNRCPHSFLGGEEHDARTVSRNEMHRLVHRDDRARFHATATRMASAYGDSDTLSAEVRMRTPGGPWRWIQARTTVFSRRETGAPLLLLGIATDITARKMAELRLLADRDAAEQASRMRGEFVARMTDEFRTALHAIVGYASEVRLDRDRRLTARDLANLDLAVDRGHRLLETVSDLHDFSAIEAGDVVVDQSMVDTCALLHETVGAFSDHPRIVDTPLRVQLPDTAAPLLTDRLRLRQALTHLVAHALAVTRTGSITISLLVRGEQRSPLAIEVAYTDGGGDVVPPGELFAPFAHAPQRADTRSAPTGVGLALTRAICEMIGCTLTLELAAQSAATIRLGLPTPSRAAQLASAFPVQPGNDGAGTL